MLRFAVIQEKTTSQSCLSEDGYAYRGDNSIKMSCLRGLVLNGKNFRILFAFRVNTFFRMGLVNRQDIRKSQIMSPFVKLAEKSNMYIFPLNLMGEGYRNYMFIGIHTTQHKFITLRSHACKNMIIKPTRQNSQK